MGKLIGTNKVERDRRQELSIISVDSNVTVVSCECCEPTDAAPFAIPKAINKSSLGLDKTKKEPTIEVPQRKELVIIGAGPHALTLVLRLLDPDAELQTDRERHIQADFVHRMRPFSHVRQHVKDILKGPSAVYKEKKQKKDVSESKTINDSPPPLTLDYMKQNTLVIDGSTVSGDGNDRGIHGWMTGWVRNFKALGIQHLRSPISAHADPYDHRSLEFFAANQGSDAELVPLKYLPKLKGRWDFHGPYNAPSTSIFEDFHSHLITAYGIQDMVTPGRVRSIRAIQGDSADDYLGLFELSIVDGPTGRSYTVQTRRLVCAMGPAHHRHQPDKLTNHLPSFVSPSQGLPYHRILQPDQIVPFLTKANQNSTELRSNQSILIVGGGITSAHLSLVLAAKNCSWCKSVTLVQRSKMRERQFDLGTAWMGPARGNNLERFWSLSMKDRAARLLEERGGGSISPEVVHLLLQKAGKKSDSARLTIEEETQILDVEYDGQKEKLLVWTEKNGSISDEAQAFDMIWLSTGFANHIANYPALEKLVSDDLPVELVNGSLPVLNTDLSWGKKKQDDEASTLSCDDEPKWKQSLRQRLFMMGPLASLELGPDALNLMGARQGAVRVAKALRADINDSLY